MKAERNTVTTKKQIQHLCEQIARVFSPERIILFGSHAYGSPGPFSDVDLLVVMPCKGSPLQQAARIISQLDPQMAVDLLVRSPQEVSERLAMRDSLLREIVERGEVAYDAKQG